MLGHTRADALLLTVSKAVTSSLLQCLQICMIDSGHSSGELQSLLHSDAGLAFGRACCCYDLRRICGDLEELTSCCPWVTFKSMLDRGCALQVSCRRPFVGSRWAWMKMMSSVPWPTSYTKNTSRATSPTRTKCWFCQRQIPSQLSAPIRFKVYEAAVSGNLLPKQV